MQIKTTIEEQAEEYIEQQKKEILDSMRSVQIKLKEANLSPVLIDHLVKLEERLCILEFRIGRLSAYSFF